MSNSNLKNTKDAKFYDYSHFPKKFSTLEDALDTYNDLGYEHNVQFQVRANSEAN